ncbi:M48 family metallopeptidase [Fibrobacterota bacterium]
MYVVIFLSLFLGFFLLEFFINWALDVLNQKTIEKNPEIPGFFRNLIDSEAYAKSQDYALARLRFNKWQMLYSNGITLVLLFSGILPWLQRELTQSGLGLSLQGVIFFFSLFAVLGLLRFPLGLYNTFKIEGAFGFNRMTLKLYFSDTIKSIFLAILIGIPLLYAFLWFMNFSGTHWWLWVFVFLSLFQVIMIIIYPTLLAPLFNKFKSLEEGELKAELLKLAEKIKFPTRGVFVMDGSRRSGHSNAYFTGFGSMRRIVLFDTLITQMSVPEIKTVLCHEMGHYKKGHVYKMLLFNFILQGIGLYVLSLVIDWEPMYRSFGFQSSPQHLRHVGLFLFMTVASTFTFLLGPLFNYRSRKHEFEADSFAVEHSGSKAEMESALLKLAEKNLSNLTPHPWYSAFHYSHPTVYERIKAIRHFGG